MRKTPRYTVEYAPEVLDHLDAVERKYHRLLRDLIAAQLRFSPEEPTRNRKLLEQPAPFSATWELRGGPGNRFRVFYEVRHDKAAVWVLAIGVKQGNRLVVGNEEIES
jgi:mRNA-degrading endonuclease RelE of RelBE toxin-antitoxin system